MKGDNLFSSVCRTVSSIGRWLSWRVWLSGVACVSVVERAFHNDDILSMGSLFEHLGYKHIYRSVSIGAFPTRRAWKLDVICNYQGFPTRRAWKLDVMLKHRAFRLDEHELVRGGLRFWLHLLMLGLFRLDEHENSMWFVTIRAFSTRRACEWVAFTDFRVVFPRRACDSDYICRC